MFKKTNKDDEENGDEEFNSGIVRIKKKGGTTTIKKERNGCYKCEKHPYCVVAIVMDYMVKEEQCCREHWIKMADLAEKKNQRKYNNEGDIEVYKFPE